MPWDDGTPAAEQRPFPLDFWPVEAEASGELRGRYRPALQPPWGRSRHPNERVLRSAREGEFDDALKYQGHSQDGGDAEHARGPRVSDGVGDGQNVCADWASSRAGRSTHNVLGQQQSCREIDVCACLWSRAAMPSRPWAGPSCV